jgi:soluble lytic murein transglycosylase-like protein
VHDAKSPAPNRSKRRQSPSPARVKYSLPGCLLESAAEEGRLKYNPTWMHASYVAVVLAISPCAARASPDDALAQLLALPRPPVIETLIGIPQIHRHGRGQHLPLIIREAEREGLPPALVDAVTQVESGFNPLAVGTVGEVGLMQIRPQTAAMLGYKGGQIGLFEPEVNVHFGVKYLARAWRLANGDLCRALTKYRAGHGEERMSPLSAEYCRRAREHLAAIGSPLAKVVVLPHSPVPTFANRSLDPLFSMFHRELKLARAQVRSRRGTRTEADSKRFWAAHEAQIRMKQAKLKRGRLTIAAGRSGGTLSR